MPTYSTVYSHTGYGVTSYFRSVFIEVRKMAENAASNGFGSNFSSAAFCLTQPIGALLVPFQDSSHLSKCFVQLGCVLLWLKLAGYTIMANWL